MKNKSKYFDLNSFGSEWTKEEISEVVKKLESLDKSQLLDLCVKFNIFFPDQKSDDVSKEDILYILTTDLSKEELKKALDNF